MNYINYISNSVSDTVSHYISKITPYNKDQVSNSLTVVDGIVKGTAKAVLSNVVAAAPLALAHLTDTKIFVSLGAGALSTYRFVMDRSNTDSLIDQLTRGAIIASNIVEIISFLDILPQTPENTAVISAVLVLATLCSSGRALRQVSNQIYSSWNDSNLAISDRTESLASGAIQALFATSMVNSLYHTLVPTETPRLPYRPQFPENRDQPDVCELQTWVGTGHGFATLNCGELQNNVGFYPKARDLDQDSSAMKLWFTGPSVGASSIASAPAGFFVGEASSLGLGSVKLTTPLSSVPGMLENDSRFLQHILEGKAPAAVSQWPLSLYQAKEVSQFIQEMGEKCDNNDPGCSYHPLFYNCISFMDEISEVAGLPADWAKHLELAPSKSGVEPGRLDALAWHWLYLAKKVSLHKLVQK